MVEIDPGQVIQKFLVSFMEPDGVDVLEIGCGGGAVTAQLAGWPASYAAVDPDPVRLEEARARVPDVAFSEGTGEDLDFPDESFDVVLFSLSLHHQDPEAALAEAHRVLRLGGRAVVLEPVAVSESERTSGPLHDETDALRLAQEALAESEFTEVRRELFRTEVVCSGVQEYVEHLFEHYRRPYDPELAARIAEILGDKAGDVPLTVNRDLLIVLLAKT